MIRRHPISPLVLCVSAMSFGACTSLSDEPSGEPGVESTKTLVAGVDRRLYDADCVPKAQQAETCASLDNPDDCDTLRIETYADGSRCQLCSGNDGDLLSERCTTEARSVCTEQARPDGSRCVACADDSGLVRYSDCEAPAAPMAVRCQDLYDQDGTPCVVCFDETGEMVRRDCFEDNGHCTEYVASDGNVCRLCGTEGARDQPSCAPPPQPAQCDVTADDNGVECVTCYSDDGMVAHYRCQDLVPPQDPSRCEAYASASGEHCQRCYTADADVIFETCGPPPPRACTMQVNDDGTTCEVCTSAQGELMAIQCTQRPCPAGQCDPPPACQIFERAGGEICEICAVLDAAGNPTLAERCFQQPNDPIFCEVVAARDGTLCEVCSNSLGEVHRACGGVGDPWIPEPDPGISCIRQLIEENGVPRECETCFDGLGRIVHESCPKERQCHLDTYVHGDLYVTCELCTHADGTESRSCDVLPCDAAPHLCGANARCWWQDSSAQTQMCELCVAGDQLLRRCAANAEACDPMVQDCFSGLTCEPFLEEQGDQLVHCEHCVSATGESYTTCRGAAPCPATDPSCADATPADCWEEWLVDAVDRPLICTVCNRMDAEPFRLCRPAEQGCPPDDPSCVTNECVESHGLDALGNELMCVQCTQPEGRVTEDCWPVEPPCDGLDCPPPGEQCVESVAVTADGRELSCVHCFGPQGELLRTDCQPPGPPPCDPDVDRDCAAPGECWEEWTSNDDGTATVCKVCILATGAQQRDCWHEGPPPPPDERVHVFTNPVQCNPWNGIFGEGSVDVADDFEELVAWVKSLNVPVFAIDHVQVFPVACYDCSCARGDRYYVETNRDGAAVLGAYGFLPR